MFACRQSRSIRREASRSSRIRRSARAKSSSSCTAINDDSRNSASCARRAGTGNRAKTAARPRPCGWAFAITLLGRYRLAVETLAKPTAGRWPSSISARAIFALAAIRRGDRPLTSRPRSRLQRRRWSRWPSPKRCVPRATPKAALAIARQPVRRGRANGRVSVSARRDGRGARRQPGGSHRACYERAVEVDGNHVRRPVRAGASKTIATATTTTPSSYYERSAARFPHLRRLAVEPGHAVRRPRPVRARADVLSAASWMSIPHDRGRGCS